MRSALYTGRVAHRRPGKHKLCYRVFMLAFDLDEAPALDARLNLFSHNRFNLISLHDRDYGARDGSAIRAGVENALRAAGIELEGGRIVLMTMPRVLNYVFNPLSVYFCYRRDGALAALAHEVSNTFGERHTYVLRPQYGRDGAITQACDKRFFVSPFLDMDLRYEFRVNPPGQNASIAMIVRRQNGETALTASFSGVRRPLTDANLLRAWAGDPLMTLKVIAGIHWEALKMWLKGVRYLGRGGRGNLSAATASNEPGH